MTRENKLEHTLSRIMTHAMSAVGSLCFLKDRISQLSPTQFPPPCHSVTSRTFPLFDPMDDWDYPFLFPAAIPQSSPSCGVLSFTNVISFMKFISTLGDKQRLVLRCPQSDLHISYSNLTGLA